MKKKMLASAIMMAVASVGFVMSASAEETMSTDVAPVVVEGQQDALPGGFIGASDRVGILGNMDAVDVPFTQQTYTEKTIEKFMDPAQGMNGILANNPSIRIVSPSPMYTDFSMRGLKMNASHYYINGVPNMFGQSRSMPAYVLDKVEVISGPNQVMNGSTFYYNGSDAVLGAPGAVIGTTKKATDEDINRYTQTFSGRGENIENIDIGRRFGKDNEWGIRVNARKDKGGLATKGAYIDDKTVYVNIDHKTAKSTTNLFGGYYDFEIKGAQRWFNASKLKGGIPKAPDGKTNFSFDGQNKASNGYMFILNHNQKLSDKFEAYANLAYQNYKEDKNDPQGGSLNFNEDGSLNVRHRYYLVENKGAYGQVGIRNKSEFKDIKNNLSLALDWFNFELRQKSCNGSPVTNFAFGTKVPNLSFATTDLYAGTYPFKDTAWSATVADRVEFGKWNAFASMQFRHSKFTNNDAKRSEAKKSCLNPAFGIGYKPTEKTSIYASHSESYTRPYLVPFGKNYNNEGEVFKPIKMKQNEIGVKYQNSKILHALALFEIDQAVYREEGAIPDLTYTQNGKNVYKGIEYTLNGKVTDKWNILGGLAYLNGKRKNTQGGTYDGKYALGTAKWNGVVAAEYEADKNNSWIARVNFSDKAYCNENSVRLPSYTTVDLGYEHKTKISGKDVTFKLMCNNLFNKAYWIGARETTIALGNPRTITLSAQFNF